ncbi:site-specific integrase [Caballeronia sp. GAOx1]|uniref:tyrosine-type recombinase/integrase n=1 Tax=Caballeronia sp. GAOx1 TaxID=2921761 RepID=UPI0020277E70
MKSDTKKPLLRRTFIKSVKISAQFRENNGKIKSTHIPSKALAMTATQTKNRSRDNVYDRGTSYQVKIKRRGVLVDRSFPYDPASRQSKSKARSDAVKYAHEQRESLITHGAVKEHTSRTDTLRPFFENYRDEVTPGKKGHVAETSRLNQLLADGGGLSKSADWLDTPIETLKSWHFSAWRDRIKEEKAYENSTVNSFLSVISAVIEWARKQPGKSWIENCARGHALSVSDARDRTAQDSDVERIIALAGSATTRLAVRLLLESAARRSEIASLRWQNVVLQTEGDGWPHMTFVNTKNGEARTIPLSPESVTLLSAIPAAERTGFVLKGTGGKPEEERHIRPDSITQAWIRGRDRLAEEDPAVLGLRLHDLRHTATTRLAKRVDALRLAKLTGHKDMRMLQRYYNPTASDLAEHLGWKPAADRNIPSKS